MQRSFLDLQREDLIDLQEGSLPWLLVRYRGQVFPEWLTNTWTRGHGRFGRSAWAAHTLLALAVLRWSEEGTSRVGACRRAETDVLWRYAMDLPVDGRTPTEKTLREFEAWLLLDHEDSGLTRKQVLHQHLVHLAMWSAASRGQNAPRWVMDSTPMWCFGAVLDTIRLLGDGLCRLGRCWARAIRSPLLAVARELRLPLMLARSTKGALRINWRDRDARSAAVSALVDDVVRVVGVLYERLAELAEWPQRQARVADLCDLLLRVIEQDLEQDEQGRWRIAQRVAQGRVVSLTDPEATHGHKSRSESFWGYKINVLGDALTGVVAALSVTPGNGHDAAPGHALVAQVQQMRIEIRRVLADTAYGGIASRLHLRSLGVELVAPPPAGAPPGERLSKNQFDIDFDRQIATCPNGTSTDRVEQTLGNVEKIAYRWPAEACAACPLQSKCLDRPISVPEDGKPQRGRPAQGKRLVLDPLERERREARAQWADPAVRAEYVQRSMGERLHVELIQHGARLARARGRAAADLQVHLIAMTVNLGILARNLAAMLVEARLCSSSATPPRRRPAASDTGRQLPLVA